MPAGGECKKADCNRRNTSEQRTNDRDEVHERDPHREQARERDVEDEQADEYDDARDDRRQRVAGHVAA